MVYELIYTKNAYRDIKKLDRVAQKKLAKGLKRLAEKPFFYAKKLILPQLGGYRFRIGDYRVIFDVEDRKIIILRVGHRKEIYRG
ncbi:MAG: type II toxin-antitoxin system RelE family toxin [Patescibacteria group bacterium]